MTWELIECKEDKNGLYGTGRYVFHGHDGGHGGAPSRAFPQGTTAHTEVRPPGAFPRARRRTRTCALPGAFPRARRRTRTCALPGAFPRARRRTRTCALPGAFSRARRRTRRCALPALFHGHDGAHGGAPSRRFPTGALAERTLGPPASPPDGGAHIHSWIYLLTFQARSLQSLPSTLIIMRRLPVMAQRQGSSISLKSNHRPVDSVFHSARRRSGASPVMS